MWILYMSIIKEDVEEVYKNLVASISDSVNMFLNKSILVGGIPFDVRSPNPVTMAAINEIENMRSGKVPKNKQSVEDLFAEMGD